MSTFAFISIAFFVYMVLSAIAFVVTGVIHAPLFSTDQFLIAGEMAVVVVVVGIALFIAIIRPE